MVISTLFIYSSPEKCWEIFKFGGLQSILIDESSAISVASLILVGDQVMSFHVSGWTFDDLTTFGGM